MRSSYAVLGCVVLVWGCVDTQLPAAPSALDAGLGDLNRPKGASKPPPAPTAGQSGARATTARGGVGAILPAAGGGGAPVSLQPAAAGAGGRARAAGQASPPAPAPTPLRAGDLVITELMIDPKTLTDNDGEWVELYNASGMDVELHDCELDDGSKTPHVISMLHIARASYVTLARQAMPGFTPTAVMPLSLSNAQDSVAIRCNGIEIDRVHYDARAGSPLQSGASLALDPEQLSATQNDALSAWCKATDSYGPELGTPGKPNPSCHPDPEDAGQDSEPEPEPEPED